MQVTSVSRNGWKPPAEPTPSSALHGDSAAQATATLGESEDEDHQDIRAFTGDVRKILTGISLEGRCAAVVCSSVLLLIVVTINTGAT